MTVLAAAAVGIGVRRRWAMLAASTLAQAATAVMVHGPAFLIPVLHDRRGLSLAEAGLVAAAPMVGVMLTLVAWGVVIDRRGERFVLLAGLRRRDRRRRRPRRPASRRCARAGARSGRRRGGEQPTSPAAGSWSAGSRPAGAASRWASGRWPSRSGVGVAAATMAVVADGTGRTPRCGCRSSPARLAAVARRARRHRPAAARRPAPTAAANPYRADRYLARIHGVSVLLVVPQFVVWTFALVWLVQDRDWSPGAAGALVAVAQLAGALGRIAVGQLSDLVASRMRPLRWVTVAAAVTMLRSALDRRPRLARSPSPWWCVATVVTVADNGLAFTAVAERAGPFWSGRALGVQNTAQFLAASPCRRWRGC